MSKISKQLLSLLLKIKKAKYRDDAFQDFEDIYDEIYKSSGYLKAQYWFWREIIRSTPKFLLTRLSQSRIMFVNYLKISSRNLTKNKGYSILNIAGLSVGMASSLLILLYIIHETGYDSYHKDVDRLYRIKAQINSPAGSIKTVLSSAPLIPVLREEYPEIEHALRIMKPTWQIIVSADDKRFIEDNILIADNELFSMFKFDFIQGNASTALTRPSTIVLTESMAKKYFGETNPVGNSILLRGNLFEITGVIKDTPSNTHIKFDFVYSLKTLEGTWDFSNWGWTAFFAYIKLTPNVDASEFEDKIRRIANNYYSEQLEEWECEFLFILENVTDIHMDRTYTGKLEPPGNMLHILLLTMIGIFLLLIAGINYMNLSTARSINRKKEVGIRKVIGARRDQLISQFLSESILLSLFSGLLAIFIAAAALSSFESIKGIKCNASDVFNFKMVSIVLFLSGFVGITSGIYPAFFLSVFKPVSTMHEASGVGGNSSLLRKTLVVGQFTISLIMIISTCMIYKQIEYMKNRYPGFNIEKKFVLFTNRIDNPEMVRNEFLRIPSVTGASYSWSVPGRMTNGLSAEIVGYENTTGQGIDFNYSDPDYIPLYGIEMIAGRNFQKDLLSDVGETFIINESAMRALGFLNPEESIGKKLKEGGSSLVGTIIGVCKDYHFKGLQSPIEPLILHFNPIYFRMLSLSIDTDDISSTISNIEKKWHELNPGAVFDFFFLEDDFNNQYDAEEETQRLFLVFTVIAIFIACLGLFALSSYTAEQKIREIGIRKTLGASSINLVRLISRDFIILVVISNLAGWPAAYFIMNIWLNDFAYRQEIGWGVFAFSGISVCFIALLTVSYQSVKAAAADPVKSLRYE